MNINNVTVLFSACVCMCVCMYVCICMYVCVYVLYVCTCTHVCVNEIFLTTLACIMESLVSNFYSSLINQYLLYLNQLQLIFRSVSWFMNNTSISCKKFKNVQDTWACSLASN